MSGAIEGKCRLVIELPASLYNAVLAQAEREAESMATIIRRAVRAELARVREQQSK